GVGSGAWGGERAWGGPGTGCAGARAGGKIGRGRPLTSLILGGLDPVHQPDRHGVSGREMLTAIIAGQRDPKVLAQMARTRMRGKIAQLEEALDCSFFTGQH